MIYLEKNNLDELIKEGTHLVDFYAEWCGPCKMLTPVLESIEDKINVIKVDIDKYRDLARSYGVMSIPCLILFEKGKEIKRNVGFMPEAKLKEFIK